MKHRFMHTYTGPSISKIEEFQLQVFPIISLADFTAVQRRGSHWVELQSKSMYINLYKPTLLLNESVREKSTYKCLQFYYCDIIKSIEENKISKLVLSKVNQPLQNDLTANLISKE